MPLTVTTPTTEWRGGTLRVQRRAPVFSKPITPDERLAAIALRAIPGLGAIGISTLFRGKEPRKGRAGGTPRAAAGGASGPDVVPGTTVGDVAEPPAVCTAPTDVLNALVADPLARAALLARAQQMLESCEARGVRVVSFVDATYPPSLFHLENPPSLLFALGDVSITSRPSVAIVGSRHATSYGLRVARDFATRLAERGVCVVSGLAAGVDAASHVGALDGGGATIAVQGTGVDVAYPRANAALHARIARDGLVLSEIAPGKPSHVGAFSTRNRTIAALADVVLVVEAGLPSGALTTADRADEIGRSVGAVPGPIDSAMSRGTNQLIRDGKHCVASFDDLLALLALSPRVMSQGMRLTPVRAATDTREGAASTSPGAVTGSGAPVPAWSPARVASSWSGDPNSPEGRLLEVLAHGPQGTDDLVRACAMAPRDVATALATLSLLGVIEVDAGGMVQRLDRSVAWHAGAPR